MLTCAGITDKSQYKRDFDVTYQLMFNGKNLGHLMNAIHLILDNWSLLDLTWKYDISLAEHQECFDWILLYFKSPGTWISIGQLTFNCLSAALAYKIFKNRYYWTLKMYYIGLIFSLPTSHYQHNSVFRVFIKNVCP